MALPLQVQQNAATAGAANRITANNRLIAADARSVAFNIEGYRLKGQASPQP
jgi:hypothetical protein